MFESGTSNRQKAQLSQRDRSMLRVIEYIAKSLSVIRNDTLEYGVSSYQYFSVTVGPDRCVWWTKLATCQLFTARYIHSIVSYRIVCPSVRYTPYSVEMAKRILKLFPPSGSYTAASNAAGMKNRDFGPACRFISDMIQDSTIVTIEGQKPYPYQFDLESSLTQILRPLFNTGFELYSGSVSATGTSVSSSSSTHTTDDVFVLPLPVILPLVVLAASFR